MIALRTHNILLINESKFDELILSVGISEVLPRTSIKTFPDIITAENYLFNLTKSDTTNDELPDIIFLSMPSQADETLKTLLLLEKSKYINDRQLVIFTENGMCRPVCYSRGAKGCYDKPKTIDDLINLLTKITSEWIRQ
jgi:hypothetical protein